MNKIKKTNTKRTSVKSNRKKPTRNNKKTFLSRRTTVIGGLLLFALLGAIIIAISRAQTNLDTLQTVKNSSNAGAKLPIQYSLSSLTGAIRYASPNGSSTSSCTANDPCSLTRAVSQTTTANSTIILYGGVYRNQANISISGVGKDGLRMIAYPDQIPEIRGSIETPNTSGSGWTSEGNYRYRAYVPRPLQEGGGVNFADINNMQNLTGDGVGRYADQAWIGTTPLKQITNKSSLQDGHFFVDRSNNRIYLTANDAGKAGIELSRPGNPTAADRDRLFQIFSNGVTIEGLRITRFSANANDYGAITVESTGHNTTLKQVELSHMPYQAIHFNLSDNGLLQNVTISNTGWMSAAANQTDNLTMDSVKIVNTDTFDEFSSSPASGALKTSRTRGTKVVNSLIRNNRSHGLWFDQSNINVVASGNVIQDNYGAGLFFEISDGLTMVNNYIAAPAQGTGQPVKLAGSSGLRIVNNTIIGGSDPLGIYIDGRSTPGCAQNVAMCKESSPGSDRQGRFASSIGTTMDWMPRIDVMVNNIIAYPRTGTGSLCGSTQTVGMCILLSHSSGASVTLNSVIHKADPARNIPQTIIDGNVYANGTTRIIRDGINNHTTVSAWSSSLSAAPVSIQNLDARGKSGNSWVNSDGTPTDALLAATTQAYEIPTYTGTNTVINQYIPSGTRYYGALPVRAVSPPPTPDPTPTDTTAPNGPASLTANPASTSQINLAWPAAVDAESGIKEYVIFRNNNPLKTVSANTLTYSDTGLAAGTSYSYQVKAVNNVNLTSTGSPVVSAKTNAPTPPPPPPPAEDTQAPSTPVGLTRTLTVNWSRFRYDLNLTWQPSRDNVGVQEYVITRNGQPLGTSPNPAYTDSTLQAGILYTYNVFAKDAKGNPSGPAITTAKANCFWFICGLE